MRTVVIESPLAGEVRRNIAYAELAVLDSLRRGEAPFASHLLYPQVLDDGNSDQRQIGMLAGFAVGKRVELCAVYVDLGVTPGMKGGITRHRKHGLEVEERSIDGFAELLVARVRRRHAATLQQELGKARLQAAQLHDALEQLGQDPLAMAPAVRERMLGWAREHVELLEELVG